jgi:hypothetical protein
MFGNWATVFLFSKYDDILLLSYSLCLLAFRFQSTIPAIDEVLVSMTDIDPVHRLDAKEAKDRLGTIFCSMAPQSLLINPDIQPRSPA